MTATVPPIELQTAIRPDPAQAFELFFEGFGEWWPAAYAYAGETGLQRITLGARAGDFCHEIGPDGFRVDWGRLTEVDRPTRLKFLWQIAPDRTPSPDPKAASEVEVVFESAPAGGTRLRLTHGRFERHGEGAAAYRDQMAADEGWPYILERFAAYADGRVRVS